MSTLKKPDLSDPKLRAKLAKGMGHNYYGEPAWPNDLLYIFPVCILGTISCCIGLGVLEPTPLGEKADPFATPFGSYWAVRRASHEEASHICKTIKGRVH